METGTEGEIHGNRDRQADSETGEREESEKLNENAEGEELRN